MHLASLYVLVHARGLTRLKTKLNIIKKSLTGVNSSLSMFSTAATTAFLAAGAAMALALHQSVKFEKQLAMVATMLNGPAKKTLEGYAVGLQKLSKTYGESTETLSKDLYDILSASVDASDALYVLEVSARAATAGMTTTAVSADAITTILNAFNMSASRAAEVSDLLFQTVKKGKLTYEELGNNIGKLASTAAIAGVSLEEMMATISTVTRQGLKADRAMNSIVGALRAFLKPTKDAAIYAKQLGIDMSIAGLKAEGLAGIFKKFNGLTEQQVARLIPNIRGLKAIAAALADTEGYANDLELMYISLGATEEAYYKQVGTGAYMLKQLKEEALGLFKTLGQQLLPVLKKALTFLINLTQALSNNSTAILRTTKNIASTVLWLAKWVIGLKILVSIVRVLPALLLSVAGASKLVSAALAAIVAHPVVAAITAIVAVVGLLILKYLDLEKILKTTSQKIGEWAENNRKKIQKEMEYLDKVRKDQISALGLLTETSTLNKKDDKTEEDIQRLAQIKAELTAIRGVYASIYDKIISGELNATEARKEANAAVKEAGKQEIKLALMRAESDIALDKQAMRELDELKGSDEERAEAQLQIQQSLIQNLEVLKVLKEKMATVDELQDRADKDRIKKKKEREESIQRNKLIAARDSALEQSTEDNKIWNNAYDKLNKERLSKSALLDIEMAKELEDAGAVKIKQTEAEQQAQTAIIKKYAILQKKVKIEEDKKAREQAKKEQDKKDKIQLIGLQKQLTLSSSLYDTFFGLLPQKMKTAIEDSNMLEKVKEKFGEFSPEVGVFENAMREKGKGQNTGQFEGIGDIWKRIQSAAARPEMKYQKEMLSITKDLGEDSRKTRVAIEAIQNKGLVATAAP